MKHLLSTMTQQLFRHTQFVKRDTVTEYMMIGCACELVSKNEKKKKERKKSIEKFCFTNNNHQLNQTIDG